MIAVRRYAEDVAAAVCRDADAVRGLLHAEMPLAQLVHPVDAVDVEVAIRLGKLGEEFGLALLDGEVRVPRANRDDLHDVLRTTAVGRVEKEHVHVALVERPHRVGAARELHVFRREPHMLEVLGPVVVMPLRDRRIPDPHRGPVGYLG